MRSVFAEGKGKRKDSVSRNSPSEFQIMARRFIEVVRNKLDDNEVRAMVANEVACPSLKVYPHLNLCDRTLKYESVVTRIGG